MSCNELSWFEIPVLDMARAKYFYSGVFGLAFREVPVDGFEMAAFEGDVVKGALVSGAGYTPSDSGTVLYFVSNQIDEKLQLAEQLGGRIISPTMEVAPHGFVAHLVDSEGNRIAIQSKYL
ncbi:VOC family protein [bacterium]|nr:VOC family protein [bacterium]